MYVYEYTCTCLCMSMYMNYIRMVISLVLLKTTWKANKLYKYHGKLMKW